MARVNATVKVDRGAVRAYLTSQLAGSVGKATGRVRDTAKANITAAGRVDTGLMRNSVVSEVTVSGTRATGRVEVRVPYGVFQHEGTTGPILPRRARVLRFRPRGATAFVFAPQVAGVTGVPFLTDALRSVTVGDFL